jgi:hypothetical protein
VVLGVIVLIAIVAGVGSNGSSGGASDSDSSSTGTGSGSSGDGLNADAGHENTVKQGAGFQLGDFRISSGWRVAKEPYLGWDIKRLVVKNTTNSSHDFLVDVRLIRGKSRVVADITCSTLNSANPGQVYDVKCVPDGNADAKWDHITFANTY